MMGKGAWLVLGLLVGVVVAEAIVQVCLGWLLFVCLFVFSHVFFLE